MKATKLTYLMAVGLALTFAATGCKKTPTKVTDIRGPRPGGIGELPPGDPIKGDGARNLLGNPNGIPVGPGHPGWPEDVTFFQAQTVHFDFDSSTVKSSELSKLEFVAAHLKSDTACAIKVQGHCDERGTEEYNRSLGERRALSLREELIRKFDIAPDRIDTISFGEDQPVATGHDEAAYSQNRRGVFVLLNPPK